MKSDKKAKELSAGRAKRSRKPKPRDGGRISPSQAQRSGLRPEEAELLPMLEALKPHDHLCLIYESKAEWRAAVVPFISAGLKRGEKCLYIVDTSTADEIRTYLGEEGVDVASAEDLGQLAILNETDAYTPEGLFDPDRMIALLIAETEKAVAEGFPALRATGEMTWVLRGYPGSERLLEYEAKLNRDFFPRHPCLAICQYDRWKFNPEIIKGVVMTHPLLINQNKVYRNFYYIPPAEFLTAERAKIEVQHWLNNLEREKLTWQALREREEKMRSILRAAPIGIGVVVDRVFKDVNQRFCDLTGYTREELINKSARMVYPSEEEYQFVGREKYRQIADRGTGAVETRFRRKDGRVIDVWLSSAPLDISDVSRGVTFTALDITERKKAEETLKRKMEELASLSRASQTVTASLDVDKVLSEIVVLAGKVANSDYASVVLVDEEGHIIGRSAETLPGAPALEYRARGSGFTNWIIQSRRPAVVDDIGEDGSIRSDLEEGAPTTVNPVLPACGIKSFVGLPLIFKERLLGVLYLHSLHPHTFSDQLPLLTAFANQTAVAVENANLYDEVQRELAERKVAEANLSRTVSLLEATLNSTADGILVVDLEGKIQRFNEKFREMWRIPTAILETKEDDRALGFVLDQLKDPEKFLSKVRQLYGEVLAESYDTLEFKDGRVFERFSRPQFLGTAPVGRVWSFRDVTEREKDEEKLRAALEEREVMLREIHHRVKSNIQIVSSLLRLQSRYIKDEKALEVLNESQNRIKSMALIHEKLYQSQDFARIDFSDYIAKMITHLFAIYKVEFGRIRHNVEAKNIQLDINRAIPCGLIINELITNALKHAFPEDREGEILVRMRPSDGDKYELTVKDNGVGLPEGFDIRQKGTLGFQIVSDLVKQLDGSIEIRRDAGSEIIIRC